MIADIHADWLVPSWVSFSRALIGSCVHYTVVNALSESVC